MKKLLFILMIGSLFATIIENIDVIKQYEGTIYKDKIESIESEKNSTKMET